MKNNLLIVRGSMFISSGRVEARVSITEFDETFVDEKPTFYVVDFKRLQKSKEGKILIDDTLNNAPDNVFVRGFFVNSDRETVEAKAKEFLDAKFSEKMNALAEKVRIFKSNKPVFNVRYREES